MSGSVDLGLLEGPVLLFGGPYSNAQATQALQDEASGRGLAPTQVICTGDVVAYCADPEPTVQLIRDWGIAVVQGNCEESLGNDADDCGCGFASGSACELLSDSWYPYARRQLSAASRAWMRTLPQSITFTLAGRRVRVVHGGVRQNNRFLFASSPERALQAEFDQAEADLVIGGHCGIPFGRELRGGTWLNAGVIGMPANDGTADGWYLCLEARQGALWARWHRLRYAAATASQRMAEAGLPSGYRDALLSGRWPSLDVLPARERQAQSCALSLAPMRL